MHGRFVLTGLRQWPPSERGSARVMSIVLLAVLLNSFAYTGFSASMAWEALRVRDSAGSAALLFAIASAAALGCGPFLGAWVDRLGPRRAFITSQVFAATAVVAYAGARQLGLSDSYTGLVLAAVLNSVGGALYSPAMHGVIQCHSTSGTATTAASRTGVAVALGFVLGYSIGGLFLDSAGVGAMMLLCGALYLAGAGVLARAHVPEPQRKRGAPAATSGVLHGLRYLLNDRALRDAALGFVLCYTIFHLVTALLAPFSKLVLHADASQFGLLRATWSIGSALGSLLLTAFWGTRQLASGARFLVVAVLGALFVVFAQAPNYGAALVLIGLVGGTHAACRAFLDGLLLQVCDSSVIGRVRSNVNSLLSAVSLTVFALSSLVSAESIRGVFAGTGLLVALSCVTLYARAARVRAARA
jgi:MFS family permease